MDLSVLVGAYQFGLTCLLTKTTEDNVTFAGTIQNGNMHDNWVVGQIAAQY